MISAPTWGATPSPTPSLDLTNIPESKVQEIQKGSTSTAYQIGDRIGLSVEIKVNQLDPNETFSLSVPEGSSKLEDQGWYVDPSTQYTNGVLRFIVSPIQMGKLTLPTLIISKSDHLPLARTSPYTVQVGGPNSPAGAKPELLSPITIGLSAKYWILFSLLAIGIGIILFKIYRKYNLNKKKVISATPPIVQLDPIHIAAYKKIESLYQKYPYQIDNLKPISFGISEILKEFFSKRFKIDAQESTTDEMIDLLRKESFSSDQIREVKTLFEVLDLIKFTKQDYYRHLDQSHYHDFKVKAQYLVQKWALPNLTPAPRGERE